MTNDLLPDEIFARITRSQVRTWVRGEAEIKKTKCATKQARYIRADLASTPNKTAEVDQFLEGLLGIQYENRFGFKVPTHEKEAIEWAIKLFSSHLATGKGGDWETPHDRRDRVWSAVRLADKQYDGPHPDSQGMSRPEWIGKAVMKVLYDDGAKQTEQQKTAAPTQIDAGELEKAIQYVEGWADSTSKKASPFEAEDLAAFFDVCAAARAHLAKLSGGDAPQCDMVAVPRGVVEKAVASIRFALNMDNLSDAEFSKLDLSLAMLQPYTKGE